MIKITAPIKIVLLRKTKKNKTVHINLNNYRNQNRFLEGTVKKKYCELMKDQLFGLVFSKPINVQYVVYYGRGGKHDRSNVLSIVEKYFLDALTHYNCIPDDNDDYVYSSHYYTGGIDREFPRVEITITEVE